MSIESLIFVGLNAFVAALHRETGELVWKSEKMHPGYVTLLLDGDRLIVSTNGYIYCLSPYTGKILWHNPMKGFGMGAPTAMVSVRGQTAHSSIIQAADADAKAAWMATQGGVPGAF